MIRRALTVLDLQGWHLDEPEKMRRKALRWADNIAICSCYSCCNVRRGLDHRLTRPEIRQQLELLEWRLDPSQDMVGIDG